MQDPDKISEFADRLTAAQAGLYSYILTLLPWPDQANDVLQETNLILWREAAEFSRDRNFQAWACRIAYFQVRTHRRKSVRDRIIFGDAFLEGLAQQAMLGDDNAEEERLFLRECLKDLSPAERELIRKRYDMGKSVKAIATEVDEVPASIAVVLFRIRQALMKCVQDRLAQHDRR
jgi:RNA polymerase sigma-70 factor, ECF subfamily